MGLFLLFCMQYYGFNHSADGFVVAGMKSITGRKVLQNLLINW